MFLDILLFTGTKTGGSDEENGEFIKRVAEEP